MLTPLSAPARGRGVRFSSVACRSATQVGEIDSRDGSPTSSVRRGSRSCAGPRGKIDEPVGRRCEAIDSHSGLATRHAEASTPERARTSSATVASAKRPGQGRSVLDVGADPVEIITLPIAPMKACQGPEPDRCFRSHCGARSVLVISSATDDGQQRRCVDRTLLLPPAKAGVSPSSDNALAARPER
jgi:hypothetical protein